MAAYGENLIVSKPYLFDPSLYIKALKLCSCQNVEKQFVLIHGNSVTNGFVSNLQLNNSLLNLYLRQGDVKHARKLFDRMPKRDVGSWTAMISGYSQRGYHRRALLLFKEMRREPLRANDFTYGSVLKSCKDLGCLREGMQIHGCVEKGKFTGNLVVRSALLCLYAKCGKMKDVRLLFESMKQRDLMSWNIMINGYAVSACADTSFSLFQSMLAEGNLYLSLLSTYIQTFDSFLCCVICQGRRQTALPLRASSELLFKSSVLKWLVNYTDLRSSWVWRDHMN